MLTESVGAVAVGAPMVIVGAAPANPDFIPIGDLKGGDSWSAASGVSPNGRFVVGSSRTGVTQFGTPIAHAFLWSMDTGLIDIGVLGGVSPSATALAVSDDGGLVTGHSTTTGNNQGFVWTPAQGMVGLGGLNNPSGFSIGYDVAPDGSMVVGTSIGSGPTSGGFTWTPDGGMVGVPLWTAVGASGDGSVIVGYHAVPFRAVRWVVGEPAAQELGSLSGATSFATGVSSDGAVVVGQAEVLPSFVEGGELGGTEQQGFIWTAEGGMVGLPILAGSVASSPLSVNADGTVIVGYTTSPVGDEAFIWREGRGTVLLRTFLIDEHELDLEGWVLRRATGISDDGATIVGWGVNPDGDAEGWVARLPICQGDFDGDGVVASSDLNRLLHAFGDDDAGDIDGDGDTDSDDLNDLLRAFGCQAGAPN